MSRPKGRPKGIHKGRPRGAQKGNRNAVRAFRRVRIGTTVAPETFTYLQSMKKDNMSVGDLIDAAIKLYREAHPNEQPNVNN